jgi:PTS system beta-glucosides-specific IIC component
MASKDYTDLANSILENIGGKENVTYFDYCTTRLRVNVKDKDLVDVGKLSKTDGVLASKWMGGQLQVIIGTEVGDVHKAISKIADFNE